MEEDLKNIIDKEIVIKFKKEIPQEFAKEFIQHNGDSIKENQSSDLWKIASSIIIEVPKGKEEESCEYYNSIRFVEEARHNYKPKIFIKKDKVN